MTQEQAVPLTDAGRALLDDFHSFSRGGHSMRDLIEHVRAIEAEAGRDGLDAPTDAVEILREAIHAHLCQHNDNEWNDVDVAKAILTPWVRNALRDALTPSDTPKEPT